MKKNFNLIFKILLINMMLVSSLFAQSEKTEQERPKPVVYYMVLLDIGEKWKNSEVSILQEPTLEKVIQEHSQYIHQMYESGALVLGGPFLDNLESFMEHRFVSGGMCLYKTATLQEAEEKVKNDPIIQSGAMVVKDIKPFLIFVGGVKPIK